MKILKITFIFLAYLFAAVALLVATFMSCQQNNITRYPHRNPEQETLKSTCVMGAKTIRLYEGMGGATSADYFNITMQSPGKFEAHVLHIYGSPFVEGLECERLSITLKSADPKTWKFSQGQLFSFTPHPCAITRGEYGETCFMP